jgi:hypothetical protein
MERRFVIALVALVLSLAALGAGGLYVAAAPPDVAPATAEVSQRVLTEVAHGPLAPAGMSGEFASRRLADAGSLRVPSAYHPSDRWRLGLPGAHRSHVAGFPPSPRQVV